LSLSHHIETDSTERVCKKEVGQAVNIDEQIRRLDKLWKRVEESVPTEEPVSTVKLHRVV